MKHLKTLTLSLLLSALLTACATTDTPQTTDSSLPATATDTETGTESGTEPIFLSGTELHSETFAPYDITAINVWATWCGPCIDEMPYLQELYAQLPDNMNLITICHDGESQEATVLDILRGSEAQFQSFFPDETITQTLMSQVVAFPTTFFVDKDGKLIGDAFRGAPSRDVVETYLKLMNNALSLISE